MNIYLFRLKQTIKFGWKDAKEVAQRYDASRIFVYFDILRCFFCYRLRSFQYVRDNFWTLSEDEREKRGVVYKSKNTQTDDWTKDCYDNRVFLNKWKKYKWETSGSRYHKRLMAYTKRYNLGKGCIVHYDVVLERNHGLFGTISIGNGVSLTKHVYIDYSGEVIIRDHVLLSNGVIIESHSHTSDGLSTDSAQNSVIPTKLIIEDWVSIGARAVILETCSRIGRGARIGAGTVVRSDIPPYAIVTGNPAKIVGFVFTPSALEEFEEDKYPQEERISIEEYEANFNKYVIKRMASIKDHISL